jgi:hypothetical protein
LESFEGGLKDAPRKSLELQLLSQNHSRYRAGRRVSPGHSSLHSHLYSCHHQRRLLWSPRVRLLLDSLGAYAQFVLSSTCPSSCTGMLQAVLRFLSWSPRSDFYGQIDSPPKKPRSRRDLTVSGWMGYLPQRKSTCWCSPLTPHHGNSPTVGASLRSFSLNQLCTVLLSLNPAVLWVGSRSPLNSRTLLSVTKKGSWKPQETLYPEQGEVLPEATLTSQQPCVGIQVFQTLLWARVIPAVREWSLSRALHVTKQNQPTATKQNLLTSQIY